jgi:hypothetical protein
MIADYPTRPPRLAPFLAQWDYMSEQLMGRLSGIGDEEYLWEPAPVVWTVRREADGRALPTGRVWAPEATAAPPRTIAWSVGHLAWGSLVRADYLVGEHQLSDEGRSWPMAADEGLAFLAEGLGAWRSGLDLMSDEDLDTIGRSAFPRGLDPTLPLLDIVWWVNKELVEHAAEIWYVRDLYAASH